MQLSQISLALTRLGGFFSPAQLFANGEQGFWYDPTDIPLAWRRNLLTYTEQFDNAVWVKGGLNAFGSGSVVNTTATLDPLGGNTADFIQESTAAGQHIIYGQLSSQPAQTLTGSIYLKYAGRQYVSLRVDNGAGPYCVIDLLSGSVVGGSGVTVASVGNGWYRLVTTKAVSAGSQYITVDFMSGTNPANFIYTGDGTSGIYIWGAQLELGSTASTYQQIVTPEISFLQYQSQPVLYTDSAGTTPVTAVEQAVGLMLDKSKGLVLGPELAPNVPTNGAWSSVQAGWTVGGGLISVNSSVAGSTYIRNGTSVAGSAYQITFTVASFTSGTGVSAAAGTALGSFVTAPGTYTQIVFANSTAGVGVYAAGSSTVATISNVSAKLLPGNHAFQTTSAKRPVLRARYNLLTYSEQLNVAPWTANNVSVTPNVAVAPDGTATADKIIPNTTNTAHNLYASFTYVAGTYTLAFFAKAAEYLGIQVGSMFTGASVKFNLSTGVVGSASAGYTGTMTAVGNGWYRCAVSWTASAGADLPGFYVLSDGSTNFFAGDGTSGILVWGADLRPTSQATGLIGPTYQRIAAATDYDVVGYLSYLAFDGVDDALTTNSIDFATVTSDGQARRNLLTFPTQFDDPAWSKAGVSPPVVTANQTTAPDGTNTADRAVYTSPTAGSRIEQSFTFVATTYTFSCYAKSNTGTTQTIALYKFDGTLETNSGNLSVGTDWVRLSWTFSAAAGAGSVNIRAGSALANVDVFLWGAQLETGSTATAFQNIGTDKMTVFAGVRKLSDAADAVLTELSASSSANNGSFLIAAPWDNPTPSRYLFRNRGTNLVSAATTDAAYTAPVTNVVSAIGDISGDVATLRVNGTQAGTTSSDQGTGNYGNYPLFIGARNQTSLYYNGWLTQLIGVGASVASGQISATEQWVGVRTGVQI